MNIGNECSDSGKKIIMKKRNDKKSNSKKNLEMMNDPAFHLNKTLKVYINNRLKENKSSGKKETLKNSAEISNINEKNPIFKRTKTFNNITNKKKIFSKKKISKLMKPSHFSRSKKKLIKSISTNKFNLSNYINFLNNRNININTKINKNKILKKNSNNSQKYIRYSGSTALSNNDTNQMLDKNNSIIPYNNNIKILTNHSTLDINNLKNTIIGQTTTKKKKFSMQYFPQNLNNKNKYSNLTNIKNNNKNKNINFIRSRQNLIRNYPTKIDIIDKIKKSNNNIISINKTENNIKYKKINNIDKENSLYKSKDINDNKYSYNISNNNKNSTPKKIINNTVNDNNLNNINNFSTNNKKENEINSNINDKYLKKIEMLENENKLLKNEINVSNNRLLLLENKINELLIGKNSIEKEECPQPTPYVKKYSLETIQNTNQSPLNINNNSEVKNNYYFQEKEIKDNIKNISKEKFNNNKIQIDKTHLSIKINSQNSKLYHLKTNKSPFYIKERNNINTPAKINVNKYSKNKIITKKEKKKTCKKINNLNFFGNNNYGQNNFNFLTEENKLNF